MNAIILAAGSARRLFPYCNKSFIQFESLSGIERIVAQLLEANIQEIYVVINSWSEDFKMLQSKYQNINFIVNENALSTSNITSLLCVIDHLENSFIINTDVICKENIFIKKYPTTTQIASFRQYASNEDWSVSYTTDQENKVIRLEQISQSPVSPCYVIAGIMYVDREHANFFKTSIKKWKNTHSYWIEPILESINNKEIIINVDLYAEDQILTYNTWEDLKKIDSFYVKTVHPTIKKIANALEVDPLSIHNIEPIYSPYIRIHNIYRFWSNGKLFVYKQEQMPYTSSRSAFEQAYSSLRENDMIPTHYIIDSENGIYLMDGCFSDISVGEKERRLHNQNLNDISIKKTLDMIRKLDTLNIQIDKNLSFFHLVEEYECLDKSFTSYLKEKCNIDTVLNFLKEHDISNFSYRNGGILPANILLEKYIIDFEMSFYGSIYAELSVLCDYFFTDTLDIKSIKETIHTLASTYFDFSVSDQEVKMIFFYIILKIYVNALWENITTAGSASFYSERLIQLLNIVEY